MALDPGRAARIAALSTPAVVFKTTVGSVNILTTLYSETPILAPRMERERQMARHRAEQLQPIPTKSADADYREYRPSRRRERDDEDSYNE